MRLPECIWPIQAALGEGAFWSARDRTIWWVDILGQTINRCSADGSDRESWPAPQRVGFVLDGEDQAKIVGMADGLYRWRPGDAFEALAKLDITPINRLNDGTVGQDGAIWFGSKNEQEDLPTGSWFRWDGSGAPAILDGGYVVTNGPAFSPDGKRAFFSDSTARRILVRELGENGSLGQAALFVEIEDGAGYPDGMAVDEAGCIWVAMWAGWAVRRYSPDGVLMAAIDLPCANVTKPAFGGEDRTTLFITTATVGLSSAELVAQPLAGGLFAVQTDVRGAMVPAFTSAPTRSPVE
jgi:xylono-1,5-lactonase